MESWAMGREGVRGRASGLEVDGGRGAVWIDEDDWWWRRGREVCGGGEERNRMCSKARTRESGTGEGYIFLQAND